MHELLIRTKIDIPHQIDHLSNVRSSLTSKQQIQHDKDVLIRQKVHLVAV
jgi:hypothetical protein